MWFYRKLFDATSAIRKKILGTYNTAFNQKVRQVSIEAETGKIKFKEFKLIENLQLEYYYNIDGATPAYDHDDRRNQIYSTLPSFVRYTLVYHTIDITNKTHMKIRPQQPGPMQDPIARTLHSICLHYLINWTS